MEDGHDGVPQECQEKRLQDQVAKRNALIMLKIYRGKVPLMKVTTKTHTLLYSFFNSLIFKSVNYFWVLGFYELLTLEVQNMKLGHMPQ